MDPHDRAKIISWDLNPLRDRIRELTRAEQWRGREWKSQERNRNNWYFQTSSHATELLQQPCQHIFHSTAVKASLQASQAPWWHSAGTLVTLREGGTCPLSSGSLTLKESGLFVDIGTVKGTPLFLECATKTIDCPDEALFRKHTYAFL